VRKWSSINKFTNFIIGMCWGLTIILFVILVNITLYLFPIKNGVITKQNSAYLEPFPNQTYFMVKNGSLSYYGKLNDKDKGVYTLSNKVRIHINDDTTEILHLPILVTYKVTSRDSVIQKLFFKHVKENQFDSLFIDKRLLKFIN
jgi:hypothetical protein